MAASSSQHTHTTHTQTTNLCTHRVAVGDGGGFALRRGVSAHEGTSSDLRFGEGNGHKSARPVPLSARPEPSCPPPNCGGRCARPLTFIFEALGGASLCVWAPLGAPVSGLGRVALLPRPSCPPLALAALRCASHAPMCFTFGHLRSPFLPYSRYVDTGSR